MNAWSFEPRSASLLDPNVRSARTGGTAPRSATRTSVRSVARRSRYAVQLPKSASGFRLCRHTSAGSCTDFCQYKLFTKIVVAAVLLIGTICVAVWLGAEDGPERVRDTILGVGVFLVVTIPLIIIENRRSPD